MKNSILILFTVAMTCINTILIFNIHIQSKEVSHLKDKIEKVDDRLLGDSVLINLNLWAGSQKLPIDFDMKSSKYKYQLIYRYSAKMCQACIQNGIDIFNDTFKGDFNDALITVRGKEDLLKLPYKSIEFEGEFFYLDHAEKPYFILINNYGQILFFIPVDFKDNTTRTLLLSIKKYYFHS